MNQTCDSRLGRGRRPLVAATGEHQDPGGKGDCLNPTHVDETSNGCQTIGPLQTDAAGQAKFSAALRAKVTSRVDPVTHERERIFLPPTLTVSRTGFSAVTLRLLEDPVDV